MEYDSCLVGIDGVYGGAVRKVFAEADHALSEANLAKSLMALFLRNILGRSAPSTTAFARGVVLCCDGGVVYDLVVNRFVCITQRGIEDG